MKNTALLLVALLAQQSAPTFRSNASVIEVDVIIRDRDGKFIGGMTADDFELLEDGKPHPIQQFYLVSNSYDIGAADVSGNPVVRGADRRAARMFVLYFDQDHLTPEGLTRLKNAAEGFITRELGGTDVAGIVSNGRMVGGGLTNVKDELIKAIKSVKPAADTRAARLRSLRDFPRIESEFEAWRIDSGDVRLLREATERVCAQNAQLCLSEGGGAGGNAVVMERMEVKARQYVSEARGSAGRTIRSLETIAKGLARMPGRKTLVLMTDGFFVEESRPELLQIAAQAARNGVAVYGIDGRGLAGSGTREMPDAASQGPGLSTGFDTAGDGAEILASSTGGMVIRNAGDFGAAFGRIAQDTSTYYVIGYAPENSKLDGKFRKIEVRSKTRGLQVRARRGYLATPMPQMAVPRGGG